MKPWGVVLTAGAMVTGVVSCEERPQPRDQHAVYFRNAQGICRRRLVEAPVELPSTLHRCTHREWEAESGHVGE